MSLMTLFAPKLNPPTFKLSSQLPTFLRRLSIDCCIFIAHPSSNLTSPSLPNPFISTSALFRLYEPDSSTGFRQVSINELEIDLESCFLLRCGELHVPKIRDGTRIEATGIFGSGPCRVSSKHVSVSALLVIPTLSVGGSVNKQQGSIELPYGYSYC
jgi:hypothetical protein